MSPPVPLNATLANVYRIEGAVLKGTITLLGASFHVYFIEVREVPDDPDPPPGALVGMTQEAVDDPLDYYGDVQRLNNGYLATVRVPGFDGRYVAVVYPFAR